MLDDSNCAVGHVCLIAGHALCLPNCTPWRHCSLMSGVAGRRLHLVHQQQPLPTTAAFPPCKKQHDKSHVCASCAYNLMSTWNVPGSASDRGHCPHVMYSNNGVNAPGAARLVAVHAATSGACMHARHQMETHLARCHRRRVVKTASRPSGPCVVDLQDRSTYREPCRVSAVDVVH
jgi:hypothetical protein